MKLDPSKPMMWRKTKEPVHYIGRTRGGLPVIEDRCGTMWKVDTDGWSDSVSDHVINVPEKVQGWCVVYGNGDLGKPQETPDKARRTATMDRAFHPRGIIKIDAEIEPFE
jgi:hypothetical protein